MMLQLDFCNEGYLWVNEEAFYLLVATVFGKEDYYSMVFYINGYEWTQGMKANK